MLLTGARPRPFFGPCCQSGSNRIPFDIGSNPLKFAAISYPMIEGFVLPEGLAWASEHRVCITRGDAFDTPRDAGSGTTGARSA